MKHGSILPCLNGSEWWWWCNGEGDIFLAHFGPLITNWASFKCHSLPEYCCWPYPSLFWLFCVATIIFQHCLNPLGHGVHQSFTGPLPLLHDVITELVAVRDLALLHLPFEDAPQMPHLASPSPLPLASLASQWSSWGCVWGSYHVGILPCSPVSKGRGSCSASICHSTCWHS